MQGEDWFWVGILAGVLGVRFGLHVRRKRARERKLRGAIRVGRPLWCRCSIPPGEPRPTFEGRCAYCGLLLPA